MAEERQKGHFVPIGVEGPSAGTVLRSATSRDGLSTALLTALALTDSKIRSEWASHLTDPEDQQRALSPDATLSDLTRTLPSRITFLGSRSDLQVSMAFLKQTIENEFRHRWITSLDLQHRYPEYRFQHYEELTQRLHISNEGLGGWSLTLKCANGDEETLWLRSSRTGSHFPIPSRCCGRCVASGPLTAFRRSLSTGQPAIETTPRVFPE